MLLKNMFNKYFSSNFVETNESARVVWIAEKLKNLPSGSSLLDAGAGECQHKQYCEHLVYTAQDFGQYIDAGDSKALQVQNWDQTQIDIICDITNIPRPDESYDAILCAEVLEHLPNPIDALKEFSRLLKPQGQLILTAPFCAFCHMSPYFFGTGFSSYWYNKHLQDLGFEIIELVANGDFPSYMQQEVGRIPSVAERYSNIKLTLIEKIAQRIMMRLLNRMKNTDKGSNELTCFGYHVLARKK